MKPGKMIEKIWSYSGVRIYAAAMGINYIIEILSHRGIVRGTVFAVTNIPVFLYNALIIAFTLYFAKFFKRKRFVFSFIALLWIAAGVVDWVLLMFRKTPFTAADFMLLKDAIKVVPAYVNNFGLILIAASTIITLIGVVYLWKKAPISKEKVNFLSVVGGVALMWLAVWGCTVAGLKIGILSERFGNIGTAYKTYGFVYCFSNSIVNRGISKPEKYSDEYIESILDGVKEPETDKGNQYPNIIFLQLESFMDPNLIEGVEFSENPVPVFEKFYEEFPSGYLNVPSFGAGTANTEFEVMTGMNLDDFGPGEYPYKTVLRSQTCESMAYNLRNIGFTAHAIHNNDGTFYERNSVFENLGYDTFTSIEYMNNYECTPTGWVKDDILTEYILKALDSTENQDYIYAISVQGHGDYPEETEGMDFAITQQGFFDESAANGFTYYINQLREMDGFIEELTAALTDYGEDTVLVLYGDHLPGFSFEDCNIVNGNIYQTQYIIWNNFGLEAEKVDLEAYQLSAYVCDLLGISEGIITKYHQNMYDTEDYLEKLTSLEYDMLYGDMEVYGGVNPYEPTEIKMGLEEIVISNAYNYTDHICIEGNNFTPYSIVEINGKEYETQCVSPNMLLVEKVKLSMGDEIVIIQRGEDNLDLSQTIPYKYFIK